MTLAPIPSHDRRWLLAKQKEAESTIKALDALAKEVAPHIVGKFVEYRTKGSNQPGQRSKVTQCRASFFGLELYGVRASKAGKIGTREFSLGPIDWFEIMDKHI